VDVRVVTATNRDLVGLIRDGVFREDLFHRLNVVQFRPPPLRDRGEDVLALARHFLGHYCAALGKPALRLSKDAEEALLRHAWPGNVRELRNAIERAVILETGPEVHARSLPDFSVEARLTHAAVPTSAGSEPAAVSAVSAPGVLDKPLEEALADYERRLITAALERQRNMSRTAEALGISRHALRYRMQRLGLHAEGEPEDEAAGPPGRPNH
jgi:two-component system response regulator AtoC